MTDLFQPAAFRTALQSWLDGPDGRELAPPPEDTLAGDLRQFARVQRALYDAGWSRYGWPERAGGLGGPTLLRGILGEEVLGRRLVEVGLYSTLETLAPVVIDYAPADLVAAVVPKLLSGEDVWCQGFSEPDAGSDLASLTTQAVADPDSDGTRYVVTGKKVWVRFAQFSTRCILLARTGSADTPDHQAITAFFVDLDSPGVSVHPVPSSHGVDEFCEVQFDNVVVDASRILGELGAGLQLAKDQAAYERAGGTWQRIAYLYSRFDALVDDVKGIGLAADPDVGAAYLALHIARCRSRITQHRVADGDEPGPATSVDKVLLAEAEQLLYDTARDLLPGVIELADTDWRTEYFDSRAATISGGTAEVQRNIIAHHLLGLGGSEHG